MGHSLVRKAFTERLLEAEMSVHLGSTEARRVRRKGAPAFLAERSAVLKALTALKAVYTAESEEDYVGLRPWGEGLCRSNSARREQQLNVGVGGACVTERQQHREVVRMGSPHGSGSSWCRTSGLDHHTRGARMAGLSESTRTR